MVYRLKKQTLITRNLVTFGDLLVTYFTIFIVFWQSLAAFYLIR